MIEQVPPWRNRLARSAVNRKVGGSSPPGGGTYFRIFFVYESKRQVKCVTRVGREVNDDYFGLEVHNFKFTFKFSKSIVKELIDLISVKNMFNNK